ncbi:MAG: GNAT family N-acetyltransferase [Bdellovibrionaceae bacterium]|nr:GNAT family N-acetyltransferase [Pseudobdellovibrionaceae bacterium]NUM57414.1 GNAT family N-acetyltransferase [Pseudobdellovibrionaceae bacterium]
MFQQIAQSSLNKVSSTLKSLYSLRVNKIHKFQSKVNIAIEMGPFLLKTASTVAELKKALRLRYQVFYCELQGTPQNLGFDVDEFDFLCDHLIIIDKKNQKTVGTYRLNCSQFNTQFYSENEFNIDRLKKLPFIKLELGRACIHREYRTGVVISLLWKGIGEYMNKTNSDLLFGCASIKTNSPREAALLYRLFYEQNRLKPEFFAPPSIKFNMPQLDLWIQRFNTPLSEEEKLEAQKLIPPLFRAYLKIGAYVGGSPAWDPDFKCIDFLTILNKEDLNKSLWKKYKLHSESF